MKESENVTNFKKEIIELCKKYKLSISHEDCHGGFIIEDFDVDNIDWFNAAQDRTIK